MAAYMDFNYLYSLARNVEQKKFTTIAFWFSVAVIGINVISLIVPTAYVTKYIIENLIDGSTDYTLLEKWLLLGWAPTFSLLFSVPFFISSMSWTSLIRVL